MSEYMSNEFCVCLGDCPWRATRKRARKSLCEHRMVVVVVIVGRSFFSVSSSYMRTCHNFFKTSNGDACILKGETEMKGKREREKEKEYRDLFHPSAAFGTS